MVKYRRWLDWADVTVLHTSVTVLRTDVTMLCSDVTVLCTDVTVLRTDVTLLQLLSTHPYSFATVLRYMSTPTLKGTEQWASLSPGIPSGNRLCNGNSQ